MEQQPAQQVVERPSLAERAAAFANSDNAVKGLEKKREALQAQLAAIDKEIAAASTKRDKARDAMQDDSKADADAKA